jgi:preprotein translocase SecE subunit
MAMSVAENAPVTIERSPRSAQQHLALGSLLGALYVLGGLWIVFAGLPVLWADVLRVQDFTNDFLSEALLLMVCLAAVGGLIYGGYQLMRNQHQPGLRAGIFFASVLVFAAFWITEAIGNLIGDQDIDTTVGLVLLVIVLGGLLAGLTLVFLQPGWARLLEAVEAQGWFHLGSFKGSQGVRVRRGTVVGVLALGLCGIITLVTHRTFGYEGLGQTSNDWYWLVPFSQGDLYIPLMFKIHLLMPIVLGLALIWFAWRLVNVPTFADFLIATEAELHKVSWTTRRRLIQDTIVVLVTVFLMTIFLFAVDVMWIQILSNPWVGVLHYNPRDLQKKQTEKNQW